MPFALSGDGATPIYQPTVINAPGKYVVTRNFDGTGTLIDITASHVEVDLNGFRLQGGTTDPVIRGVSVTDVRIHGGSVIAGNPGIYFEYSTALTLENLSVTGSNGIAVRLVETNNFVVRDNIIDAGEQAIHAVSAYGSPGTIEGNRIRGSGTVAPTNEAILLQGAGASKVLDNTLRPNIDGIAIHLVSCDQCEVSGNIADDYAADTLLSSIEVDASANVRIVNNSSSEGIVLTGSSRATIVSNRVPGISINDTSHSNAILRNVLTGSGGSGLFIEGDRNHIEANTLNDKPGFGLHFASTAENNVYRANVARGNFGSGCTGTGTADFCDEGTGNTSNGDNFMPTKM